jgi:hypothetical protein
MEEEAVLDDRTKYRGHGVYIMKPGGFVGGASAGVLFALLFVAGASLLGPAASHIDLVNSAAPATPQSGIATPSGSQVTMVVTGQATTEAVPAPASAPSFSSLSALSNDSGSSLGLLFLPILLGVLIGALFYGLFTRRANAE